MTSERTFEWQLGDWLGLSPSLSWIVLALVAGGAVALVSWLYRRTLGSLTPRQRILFVTLRCGFLLSLLACIAGPAWVDKTVDSNRASRPLAVVVDRSESMGTADQHGETRLSYALRVWRKIEPDADRAFPGIRYFRFSKAAEASPDLDGAATGTGAGNETRLFSSLNQVMYDAPPGGYGSVVCLTDGLDTTGDSPEELETRAIRDHSPLYFAASQGRSTSKESLFIREIDVPGQVERNTQFSGTVVVEAHARRARDVPLQVQVQSSATLSKGPVLSTTLHLRAGTSVIPWTFSVNSGEPGTCQLLVTLNGDPHRNPLQPDMDVLDLWVNVLPQESTPILFYQGAVDWSYRFVKMALQNEPSFKLTGLMSPDLSVAQEVVPEALGPPYNPVPLLRFPEAAWALQRFHIVVLSNVAGSQLSPNQQAAITRYVEDGGGLLLLVPDNEMAGTFSGTPLEQLLPVVFEAPPEKSGGNESLDDFKRRMQTANAGNGDDGSGESHSAGTVPGSDSLVEFALPSGSEHSEVAALFGSASGGLIKNLPRFSTYAQVRSVKAGALVLAVHPADRMESNLPRPLLVSQRFGKGRVTVLLTDSLWRWKLSLPSQSMDPLVFWQQLFHVLSRDESSDSPLQFSEQPYFASPGQLCDFKVVGAKGPKAPLVFVRSPFTIDRRFAKSHQRIAWSLYGRKPLPLKYDADSESWSFQVTPDRPGKWMVDVGDSRNARTETFLEVSEQSRLEELSGLPTDTDGLRRVAESTGGALLNDGTPPNWSLSDASDPGTVISKRSEPVWDNWIVLLVCLGFYVTELVWRRGIKLL